MADLFPQTVDLTIPPRLEVKGRIHSAVIEKRGLVSTQSNLSLSSFSSRGIHGLEGELPEFGRTLFLRKATAAQLSGFAVLIAPDFTTPDDLSAKSLRGELTWLRPTTRRPAQLSHADAEALCHRARNSWIDAFFFNKEVRDDDGQIVRPGLRAPQIGAIHAALAHWSIGVIGSWPAMTFGWRFLLGR